MKFPCRGIKVAWSDLAGCPLMGCGPGPTTIRPDRRRHRSARVVTGVSRLTGLLVLVLTRPSITPSAAADRPGRDRHFRAPRQRRFDSRCLTRREESGLPGSRGLAIPDESHRSRAGRIARLFRRAAGARSGLQTGWDRGPSSRRSRRQLPGTPVHHSRWRQDHEPAIESERSVEADWAKREFLKDRPVGPGRRQR